MCACVHMIHEKYFTIGIINQHIKYQEVCYNIKTGVTVFE